VLDAIKANDRLNEVQCKLVHSRAIFILSNPTSVNYTHDPFKKVTLSDQALTKLINALESKSLKDLSLSGKGATVLE